MAMKGHGFPEAPNIEQHSSKNPAEMIRRAIDKLRKATAAVLLQ